MKRLVITLSPLILLLFAGFSSTAQNSVVNYLNTKDTLFYNNVAYKLSWSSHPADNYYKQEYLPTGENPDKYNSMLLIDFVITPEVDVTVVGQKVAEINERKKNDPVANYALLQSENTNEYLLDFSLSNGKAFGIVEWNAYRYNGYTDKLGHQGVILFGLSKRAYGNAAMDFMRALGSMRREQMKLFSVCKTPDIEIR